ncbi:MAG: YbgC/FadM family acyl-CoA thioesterase [Chakrabartia godavariana]
MIASQPDAPQSGRFVGREHRFPVRVYFEDTDFSGVVYHASYLRFMERARSDMLSVAGIDQRTAFAQGDGVYAVAELSIKYHRPAHFDDALLIVSTVEQVRAASCLIQQRVMLGDELKAEARVLAAFLTPDGRPRRQPRPWIDAFERLLPEKTGPQ